MQQKSIKELAKEKNDIKVVLFFDITLNVKNNITGETLGTLSTLDNKIKFNMALPEELAKVAAIQESIMLLDIMMENQK